MQSASRQKSSIRKRSVVVGPHKTSVSLEEEFWNAFRAIAVERGMTISNLISKIATDRQGNLSSAIRLFVLEFYQNRSNAGSDWRSVSSSVEVGGAVHSTRTGSSSVNAALEAY
jgi:predicted DNA-binding ribbon-helix-helix protein